MRCFVPERAHLVEGRKVHCNDINNTGECFLTHEEGSGRTVIRNLDGDYRLIFEDEQGSSSGDVGCGLRENLNNSAAKTIAASGLWESIYKLHRNSSLLKKNLGDRSTFVAFNSLHNCSHCFAIGSKHRYGLTSKSSSYLEARLIDCKHSFSHSKMRFASDRDLGVLGNRLGNGQLAKFVFDAAEGKNLPRFLAAVNQCRAHLHNDAAINSLSCLRHSLNTKNCIQRSSRRSELAYLELARSLIHTIGHNVISTTARCLSGRSSRIAI
mmetsp:Transcript_21390/g.41938  ORF Transcript_21390/g.41938 Transcript_21390/m.41938 type:complete len:268 (+) Transcript_21390:1871-2674(+)